MAVGQNMSKSVLTIFLGNDHPLTSYSFPISIVASSWASAEVFAHLGLLPQRKSLARRARALVQSTLHPLLPLTARGATWPRGVV